MAVITEDQRQELIRMNQRLQEEQQKYQNRVQSLLLDKGFNPSQFTINLASGEIVQNPQAQRPSAPNPPEEADEEAEERTRGNGRIPESEVGDPSEQTD